MTGEKSWTVIRAARYVDENELEAVSVEAFILECPNGHRSQPAIRSTIQHRAEVERADWLSQ